MTNAAAPLETETVVLLPVDQCHKSPSQPRRRGDSKPDDDFVASIKQKGVIQPIVTRKRKAGGWEIVFGHRRHTGAALAGLEAIPAIVRDLTDDEVFELQLIENVHRQDMHPLDEADGFKRIIERGHDVQYIAGKVGRPTSYVAQRLKLCELGKEVRAALDKDEISLGVAVLLARVPPSLQAEALEGVSDRYGEGQTSVPEAKRTLESEFLLRLDQAPFDVADATLVSKAGSCTACPKRTGQQRELFPDAARADLCIDRVCYRGKLDALWQIRKKAAAAGGAAVLEGKAATQALTHYNSGYKKLDGQEWTGSKEVKVRSLFGKDMPPVTLARDESTGAIVELVKADTVRKALKQKSPARSGGGDDSYRAQQRREDEKNRRRIAAVDLAMTEVVGRADRLGAPRLMQLVAEALIEGTDDEVGRLIIRRRGLDDSKGKYGSYESRRKLKTALKAMTKAADVVGFALELALRQFSPRKWSPASATWGTTLKALGVNFDAVERQVAAEAKAKKKAKPAARKRAA